MSAAWAADLSVRENAGQLEFFVDFLAGTRCEAEGGCAVTLRSQDGTAQAGRDYVAVDRTVRWRQGDEGARSVVVEIIDNAERDGNRTFTLVSSDAVGLLQTGTRSVEIIDDESSPLATGSSSTVTAPATEIGDVIDLVCPQIQNAEDNTDAAALRRDCNSLLAAEQNNDPQFAAALRSIAPDQVGASVGVGRQTMNAQIKNVGTRLTALRENRVGVLSGLLLRMGDHALAVEDLLPPSGAGAGETEGVGSPLSFFINGELSAGDRNGTTREEGFEFTSTGLTLGLDYRRNDGWVLGAALGLSSTTSDFDSGGDLEAVGTFATFFASRQLSRFYIEGGATVGISAFDQARKIQYTLSDGTAVDQAVSASFDGSEYSLFFNTGTELLLPRQLSITPRARIELIQLDVDGFTEDTVSASGDAGDGWRTRIDAQNSRSFLVGLGAQISWIRNRENAVWVPYGALEWVQDFDAEKSNVSGQFVGDPTGETFVFVSDSPDDSYYKLNLGTSVLFTGGRSAFIDYSNLLSIKHNSVHSFNLGFRWEY